MWSLPGLIRKKAVNGTIRTNGVTHTEQINLVCPKINAGRLDLVSLFSLKADKHVTISFYASCHGTVYF